MKWPGFPLNSRPLIAILMEIALACFVKREGPNGTVRQHPESVSLLADIFYISSKSWPMEESTYSLKQRTPTE